MYLFTYVYTYISGRYDQALHQLHKASAVRVGRSAEKDFRLGSCLALANLAQVYIFTPHV